jgi:GH15 family glucan-1,4-alpha-glucosidase
MTDLYQRSIEIILANQHPSGAYVACPNFPTYRYCWFRDGSFVAYAMDLAGEHASATRFHAWAARAVNQRAGVIQRGLDKAARGLPLDENDVLHTRLTLEGEDGTQEEWANFQLDGFGTWLWALEQHQRLCGDPLPPEWLTAAGLTADYLAALWQRPCFDCWEEHPAQVHPHTLAAIYGGLKAFEKLAAGVAPDHFRPTLAAIRAYIDQRFVLDGHFVKFSGAPAVDASLLGLALPYALVALDDPRMLATAAEIERSLLDGGVHRYPTDTYYGGGAWILLTAWLGWYYAACGRLAEAEAVLKWIEAQADLQGNLPEQVPQALNDPTYYPQWVARWGPIATPLLWSHAKYIILNENVNRET